VGNGAPKFRGFEKGKLTGGKKKNSEREIRVHNKKKNKEKGGKTGKEIPTETGK